MSLLIFILVLSILVIVHEYGHFATARSLGVRVEKFSIGFGPRLFSRTIDGVEFMVCLIPLGGYVKMAGDERSHCKGDRDEFYSHPPGHRALIVVMGPVVNYVLAFLSFCVVYTVGYPTLSAKVGELIKDYPAQRAGLRTGDQILSIDAKKIDSWEEMQRYITTSQTDTLTVVISRHQQKLVLSIKPRVEELENIFGQRQKIRLIGIKPQEELIFLKYNFLTAVSHGAQRLWEITTSTYEALYRILTGAKSAKDLVTGPIGIFYVIKEAASFGFSYLLYIVAVISASLAIFNLLPLPVLDGGHLFFLAVEKLRGRPLSPKTEEVVTRVGFSLIMCLAVFVFYSDFVRFGLIDKMIGFWQNFSPK